MTPRSIYLRAAKMVDSGEVIYSCYAISCQRGLKDYIHPYEEAFKECDGEFWLDMQTRELPYADLRELRVLMLLFAAAGCCDGLGE